MDLVTSKDQIAENLVLFDSYQSSPNPFHRKYFSDRLRLGKIFVFADYQGRVIFCPSRFAGYEDCTADKHLVFPYKNGSITTPAITKHLGKAIENTDAERAYLALCMKIDVTPSTKARTYWHLDMDANIPTRQNSGESGFPDEVSTFIEGATKRVLVNAYERNDKARSACLSHYGHNCTVCNFNFQSTYGEIGAGFMHVHHLTPISTKAQQYEINPIADLRPVCPNCHAMLHKSDPPFSVDELKELLQRDGDA